MNNKIITLLILTLCAGSLMAQTLSPIELPKPITEGGKPIMQCLKDRHTSREFSPDALTPQVLSNLLWAAWGVNREDGHRTAPSAMNQQEIDVYVALKEGVYVYDATANKLMPVLAGDHREKAGKQDFVKDAPVNLIYVADWAKMGKYSEDDKKFYSAADAGFIAENAYLYCTSEGLNCVIRGYVDRDDIAKTLNLRADQKVLLAQTIGLPPKK
jgi:SagB-type dehydrogenase family enzyme